MADSNGDKKGGRPPPAVVFEHKFFGSVKEPVFRLSEQNDEPCMFFKFGDAEVSLQFSGIKNEFDLEGTPDEAMLDFVRISPVCASTWSIGLESSLIAVAMRPVIGSMISRMTRSAR